MVFFYFRGPQCSPLYEWVNGSTNYIMFDFPDIDQKSKTAVRKTLSTIEAFL